MPIYLSRELAKYLASLKVIFDHRVSLLVILSKDLLDLGQFLCLKRVNPVGESNGIMDGTQGSGTSSRVQLWSWSVMNMVRKLSLYSMARYP